MPASESSNLIKLIKSLKQGEKRHITLELSRYKKENNLLKLYQLISNASSVTDADIRKKIKDKKFISQLSINKHKLYSTILDSLYSFHLRSSPFHQVMTMINEAYLLYSKGITKAKEELLQKAAVLAEKYELRELQLQIINLQLNYQRSESLALTKKMDPICEALKEEQKLNQLLNECIMFEHTPGSRLNPRQKEDLKRMMFLAMSFKTNSFTASYYRLRICFSIYAIPGDHLPSHEYALEIIRLFEKNSHMLQLESWRIEYIESLRNFIPAFTFYGKTKLKDFIYNEVKQLDVPDTYKASMAVNIIDSYIQNGEFFENEKKIKDIEKHIDYYNHHLSVYNLYVIYFNLSVMNFGMRNYSKALYWLNEIINNEGTNSVNISLRIMTRIVRLIIFYEMGNVDLLENYTRSTNRYLTKQDTHYRVDQYLVKSIRKMATIYTAKEKILFFKEVKNELITFSKDKIESRAFYFFDFISWLDSKIENQSFADIIKQKNHRRLKKVKSDADPE